MSSPLMLRGNVDNRDELIENLTTTVERLREENAALRQSLLRATEKHTQALRATHALRTQLTPLYGALAQVFGEFERAGVSDHPEAASPQGSRQSAVWDNWKEKLGGKCGDIIDALLTHGEMNVAQIRVAAHCGQQTVYDVTSKLNKLGLITKNGGRYSLRKL